MTIDKTDVLRYLGWKGQAIDDRLENLLDKTIAECLKAARPKSSRRIFSVRFRSEGVALEGTSLLLTGRAISKHLQGAEKAVALACTLGCETDQIIHRYALTDTTRSAIFDAAATALIESFCDNISAEIAAEAAKEGYYTSSRFSPGYGDFPIELQPGILSALNADRLAGITVASSFVMIPSKSVTAIIGLHEDKKKPCTSGCEACPLINECQFRRIQ